jgi:branched-chain amino acid transport system permease protein
MVLLGGIQTLSGPVAGAIVFVGLEEQLMRFTSYWRFILGLVIVLLVVLFPKGLVGTAMEWRERRAAKAAS